jgi:uncharacterized membrane protein
MAFHWRLYRGRPGGGVFAMLDLLMVLLTIAFFAVALLYVRGCEKLR